MSITRSAGKSAHAPWPRCLPSRHRREATLLRAPSKEGLEAFYYRTFATETVIAAVDELSASEDLQAPVSDRIHELNRGNPGPLAVGFEGRAPLHLHQGTVGLQRQDPHPVGAHAGSA